MADIHNGFVSICLPSCIFKHNTKVSVEGISKIPGLTAVIPQGAMYMMVGSGLLGFGRCTNLLTHNYFFDKVGVNVSEFKDISDDVDFTQKLVAEENVLCLPGQVIFLSLIRVTERLKSASTDNDVHSASVIPTSSVL
jgi:aspartate/methionine/tyrosine aminotransferase